MCDFQPPVVKSTLKYSVASFLPCVVKYDREAVLRNKGSMLK